ncbi:MAG: alpha/beta hydrolase [Proteobacteria bacterium]|nr:alpha/beta hydrolase [Pseudomonadota bacterium]MBI3498142.1 alpha/beta hydrolase [Pseudomonadota bacterium]
MTKAVWDKRAVANGPARVEYRIAGKGKTIVSLPGLGRTTEDHLPLGERLIAAGYRVVLPMPRGMGGSTGPLTGITLHDLAADVAKVIEAVGDIPAILCGHAYGNRVARLIATDRPDLVSHLVLFTASGKVAGTPEVVAAIERVKNPALPIEERRKAALVSMVGPTRDPTVWLDGWNDPIAKACQAALRAVPTEEWWTGGKAKVLVIQGLADKSSPPVNGRMLKEELGERCTLVELDGVGHSVPVEAPDEVAAAMIAYLKKQHLAAA